MILTSISTINDANISVTEGKLDILVSDFKNVIDGVRQLNFKTGKCLIKVNKWKPRFLRDLQGFEYSADVREVSHVAAPIET